MHEIRPLPAATDEAGLLNVAEQLPKRLRDGGNIDIALEFRNTVARYNGDILSTYRNLVEAAESCVPGTKEIFLAHIGPWIAGMGWVQIAEETPKAVPKNWPNVSFFVCKPFRGKGLGTLLLSHGLEVVGERFDGHAWTSVKKSNGPSNAIVSRGGFEQVASRGEDFLYSYGDRRSHFSRFAQHVIRTVTS